MTTHNLNTIPDGGIELWKVNGSDLFALIKTLGVVAVHDSAGLPDRPDIKKQLKRMVEMRPNHRYLLSNHRLYQVSSHIVFGA
jgi:hypothetical protein